jgi:hypothetical protein
MGSLTWAAWFFGLLLGPQNLLLSNHYDNAGAPHICDHPVDADVQHGAGKVQKARITKYN